MTKRRTAAQRETMEYLSNPGPAKPGQSLTPWKVVVQLIEPYYLGVFFRTQRERHLTELRERADGGLIDRHIEAGDILIFDLTKTAPDDGAIVFVRDDDGTALARVLRRTPTGVEFHPAAPGYPVLTGARQVYGTLAGVVRAYDREDADAAEGDDSAD